MRGVGNGERVAVGRFLIRLRRQVDQVPSGPAPGQATDAAARLTLGLSLVALDLAEVGGTQKERGEHALGGGPPDPSAFGVAEGLVGPILYIAIHALVSVTVAAPWLGVPTPGTLATGHVRRTGDSSRWEVGDGQP